MSVNGVGDCCGFLKVGKNCWRLLKVVGGCWRLLTFWWILLKFMWVLEVVNVF